MTTNCSRATRVPERARTLAVSHAAAAGAAMAMGTPVSVAATRGALLGGAESVDLLVSGRVAPEVVCGAGDDPRAGTYCGQFVCLLGRQSCYQGA